MPSGIWKEYIMRYLKGGVAGLAVAAMVAAVTTLVPDASATPTSAASTHAAVVTAPMQATTDKQGTLTSTVKGTFGHGGKLTGSFHPAQFFTAGGVLYSAGVLDAKLVRLDGTVVGTVHKFVNIPVKTTKAADGKVCDILDLVLGPLHLNLLGLHVDLNKVILHITAHSGPGQLLGNLLCAVVHLLDGGKLLQLGNLLNHILALLRL